MCKCVNDKLICMPPRSTCRINTPQTYIKQNTGSKKLICPSLHAGRPNHDKSQKLPPSVFINHLHYLHHVYWLIKHSVSISTAIIIKLLIKCRPRCFYKNPHGTLRDLVWWDSWFIKECELVNETMNVTIEMIGLKLHSKNKEVPLYG